VTSSQVGSRRAATALLAELHYAYDQASNRTSDAVNGCYEPIRESGGTVTSGDNVSITINDSALSGGSETVSPPVQSETRSRLLLPDWFKL